MSKKKRRPFRFKIGFDLAPQTKIVTQTVDDQGSTHLVRVYNGPQHITHITDIDHMRIMESLETDLQTNCTNGGKFFDEHQKQLLFNRTIIDRITRVLAFELSGTFDVEIYIPQYVQVNSVQIGNGVNGREEAEELNIDLSINLRLEVIPRSLRRVK